MSLGLLLTLFSLSRLRRISVSLLPRLYDGENNDGTYLSG